MSHFNAILLEGIFYAAEDALPDAKGETRQGFVDLMVKTDTGESVSVYQTLQPFVGQRVQLAAHHLPDNPPDLQKWGGGSCLWRGADRCPFGHHEHPHALFNVSGDGFLEYDLDHSRSEGGWWLSQPDGKREMLPLAYALVGHRGRVAVATILSVDQMREALEASGMLDSVEGLGGRIQDLRDLLGGLGNAVANREK